jgi:hypothetical protein
MTAEERAEIVALAATNEYDRQRKQAVGGNEKAAERWLFPEDGAEDWPNFREAVQRIVAGLG